MALQPLSSAHVQEKMLLLSSAQELSCSALTLTHLRVQLSSLHYLFRPRPNFALLPTRALVPATRIFKSLSLSSNPSTLLFSHTSHHHFFLCNSTHHHHQHHYQPHKPSAREAVPATTIITADYSSETDEKIEYFSSFSDEPLIENAAADFKSVTSSSPSLEVKELEDLPEQWRRVKLAWLCKELPSHKPPTLIRLLNAQRKWITQQDATYIAVHLMRIRENDASFRVYKWMVQQHWFQFDFGLATKLADYLGRDRKFSKSREIFDAIIDQGRVPCESTFHILIVAYLSTSVRGSLEEACAIYNRMVQLGGYRPRLSLHNALFRALVSKPGGSSKHYLKQAEFIFHNLQTSNLEIHKDIYAGLIWLHSYQDVVDRERIAGLRGEMHRAGIEEGRDVLISILRVCSKEGDIEEAETTWLKLLESGFTLPSQAFIYRMELYLKVGKPMKSLEVFRGMQEHGTPNSVVSYHKIIEVMSRAQKQESAKTLMNEFIESGMKPLLPAFIDVMSMYLDLSLHDKLESVFYQCLGMCRLNRIAYNIYLESLVRTGNLEKAEEIFVEMQTNVVIGTNNRACNTILEGYLASGQYVKAEKIYDLMCQKKYDIEPSLMDRIENVLSLSRKVVKKPMSLKLDKEHREILIGLLLGGVRIESDEGRRNHAIHFEFDENSDVHAILKLHIHEQYYEWLNSFSRMSDGNGEIPFQLSTIRHSYFSFFADQFWLKGRPMIPKLIHRWLSPRVLAYWYMYGGHRTSTGDILLRVKGCSREDVERVIIALKAKSLNCKVKRKGKVFWIGFMGSNAMWFWKLIEPYVPEDLNKILRADAQPLRNGAEEDQSVGFDSESDHNETVSD